MDDALADEQAVAFAWPSCVPLTMDQVAPPQVRDALVRLAEVLLDAAEARR